MDAAFIKKKIPELYFSFLKNLSKENKLELIEKLNQSIKASAPNGKSAEYFYGIWKSENTAEELIEEIRSSRSLTRRIEEF